MGALNQNLNLFPAGNSSASVTGCTGSEVEKQIGIWERRVKGLRRLQLGWDQARPPDAPASVVVDVTGDNSISVQILEPFEGAIGTKFKGKPQERQVAEIVGCSWEWDMGLWLGRHVVVKKWFLIQFALFVRLNPSCVRSLLYRLRNISLLHFENDKY